jgi:hypothetical protein
MCSELCGALWQRDLEQFVDQPQQGAHQSVAVGLSLILVLFPRHAGHAAGETSSGIALNRGLRSTVTLDRLLAAQVLMHQKDNALNHADCIAHINTLNVLL